MVKMQSGAQVTDNEFKRLEPMMPSTTLTDAENEGRIIRLKAFLALNREALEKRFGIRLRAKDVMRLGSIGDAVAMVNAYRGASIR